MTKEEKFWEKVWKRIDNFGHNSDDPDYIESWKEFERGMKRLSKM